MHFVDAKSLVSTTGHMNLYRGCTHGCIYCDSRSLCYQFTHRFEDIEVKQNAQTLLETTLRSRRKKCMISTGSMADPYQPCEKELQLTRKCLQIICQYEFGASVITKSDLVLRDLDLFEEIHQKGKAILQMTMTIADPVLSRKIEPHVCTTLRRYEVLKAFQARKIPVIVWMTPILPFLTDTEENIRSLLDLCVEAGVKGIIAFGMGMTLRDGDRAYYYAALDRMYPGLSQRYQQAYGNRYEVPSPNQDALMRIFDETCERYGILHTPESCFAYLQEMPEKYKQLSLFSSL